jgi:hypothetical protein
MFLDAAALDIDDIYFDDEIDEIYFDVVYLDEITIDETEAPSCAPETTPPAACESSRAVCSPSAPGTSPPAPRTACLRS